MASNPIEQLASRILDILERRGLARRKRKLDGTEVVQVPVLAPERQPRPPAAPVLGKPCHCGLPFCVLVA